MTPHYEDATVTLHHGDCLDVLRGLPDNSVDSVVTDPPYGLEFMGKEWDAFRPQRDARTAGRVGEGAVDGDVGITTTGYTDGGKRLSRPSFGGGRPMTYRCSLCGVRNQFRNKHSRATPDCQGEWVREAIDPTAPSPLKPFQDWCELWTAECLRVLKPGGHLLAFGGSRTYHRLTCAVEDSGFEVRDSIAWLYGSGFPKSLDVSKAIDKRRDWSLVERLSGEIRRARTEAGLSLAEIGQATLVATDGTYGKWYHRGGHMFFETGRNLPSRPEWDRLRHVLPIAPEFAEVYDEAEREVIGERTLGRLAVAPGQGEDRSARDYADTAPATPDAQKWQGWGTALKPAFEPVVVARKPLTGTVAANVTTWGTGALNIDGTRIGRAEGDRTDYGLSNGAAAGIGYHGLDGRTPYDGSAGRWPANVILDETQAAELDEQSGESQARIGKPRGADHGEGWGMTATGAEYDDQGGASRFFYVAKADASERVRVNGTAHPTVKPLALMRWLVRLVTPPGGTVLEPFAGSGTTVEACILEGFRCVAIEREADYLPLIQQRIHRRRDPVEAVRGSGEDGGLFDLLGGGAA